MTRIEFSVLGPLRVSGAGHPVEVGPGRRRATLAALVADVDRVVALDVIADRVWADPPANPTASVHTYVSRLRSALRIVDEDGTEIAAALLTEAPGYRLAVDPSAVDAVRFERAVTRARELRPERPGEAGELLESALGLWRGTPYADTVTPFTRTEATRLEQLRADAQELLVGCELDLGRHAAILDRLEGLVVAEPWREQRHAALMLALYRSGRQADALRRYERLRVALAEELGTDPGRELQDLHTAILRHDPALDAPRVSAMAAAADVSADSASAAPLPPRTSASRLVGRDAEVARLSEILSQVWAGGEPQAAVLVGEAGVGKSRLLEELAVRSSAAGVVVAWGRCWQHEGSPLLWPWIQLVRDVTGRIHRNLLESALAGRGSGVRRLVPQLTGARSADPPPFEAVSLEETQAQLFDAVTAFFDVVSAQTRVLLVLEDMQWADGASCRLVEYLLAHAVGRPGVAPPCWSRCDPQRGLLLARSGDAGRTGPHRSHASAARTRPETGGRAAARQRPHRSGARRADRARSGRPHRGQPVLRRRDRASPRDRRASGVDGPATRGPDSVREVVLRRLHRLGERELDVLRSAAVAGRTFDLELVHEVSGADEETVDEALDRATAAGFLCSEPVGFDRHRFTHALVQQALVEDTGPARRRRLHARIAEVLTRRAGDHAMGDLDRLIYHRVRAGGSDHLGAAVDLGLMAADAATRSANYLEVEAVLLQALEHVTGIDPSRAEQREMAVLVRLLALYDYFYGPEHPPSVAHRQRALTLARLSTRPEDRLAALSSQSAVVFGAADFVSTAAIVEEMLLSAEAMSDPLLRAHALMIDGLSLTQRGRYDEAFARLEVALDATRGLDTEAALRWVLTPLEAISGWMALCRALTGREDAESLRRLHRSAASPVAAIRANALGLLALVETARDEAAAALPLAEASVQVCDEAGIARVREYLTVVRAWADPALSRTELDATLAPLEGPPAVLMRPFLRDLVADAHLRAGRVADARQWHELARSEAERTGNRLAAPAVADRLRDV